MGKGHGGLCPRTVRPRGSPGSSAGDRGRSPVVQGSSGRQAAARFVRRPDGAVEQIAPGRVERFAPPLGSGDRGTGAKRPSVQPHRPEPVDGAALKNPVFAVLCDVLAFPANFPSGLAQGVHLIPPSPERPSPDVFLPEEGSRSIRVHACFLPVVLVHGRAEFAKEFAMYVRRFKAATSGTAVVEVHRSLTRTDLLFCLLPVAAFLSIVSLV